MSDTEAGIVAVVYAAAAVVAVLLLWLYNIHRTKARLADEAQAEQHRADVVRWREDAVVEPDPEPVLIARSPLRATVIRAQAAGRAAERRVQQQQQRRQGVGRHRAELRDDTQVMPAVELTTTQVEFMDALTAAGETPPATFGPKELVQPRRVEWDPVEDWTQETLLDVGSTS